jgi:hypothetical protein
MRKIILIVGFGFILPIGNGQTLLKTFSKENIEVKYPELNPLPKSQFDITIECGVASGKIIIPYPTYIFTESYENIQGIYPDPFALHPIPFTRSKFGVVGSYQINPYSSVGLGIGMYVYGTPSKSTLYPEFMRSHSCVPLWVSFKTNFNNNPISPYIDFGVGYRMNQIFRQGLKNSGFFMKPNIGVSVTPQHKKFSINLGLDYEIHYLNRFYIEYYRQNLPTYWQDHGREQYFTIKVKNLDHFGLNLGITF